MILHLSNIVVLYNMYTCTDMHKPVIQNGTIVNNVDFLYYLINKGETIKGHYRSKFRFI